MYERTIQCLNCGEQESRKQFTLYDSDTPVTLKHQGPETWYEMVAPKQSYNNAKFEKPCLNRGSNRAKHNFFGQLEKHISNHATFKLQ